MSLSESLYLRQMKILYNISIKVKEMDDTLPDGCVTTKQYILSKTDDNDKLNEIKKKILLMQTSF